MARTVAFLILALLSVFALAGCTSDDGGDGDGGDGGDGGGSGSGDPAEAVSFSDEGMVLVGSQGPDVCGTLGIEGVDMGTHTWSIPAQQDGRDVRIKEMTISLSGGPTGVDLDLYVYDSAGALLGEGISAENSETVTLDKLDAGEFTIVVAGCVAVAATYSLSGDADMVFA